MKTNFCILLFSLFYAPFLLGQNAYFYIEVDSDTVGINQVFQVRYTIENAEAYSFTPPTFYDFEQMPGEGTVSEHTNINGHETKKFSYTYTLKPTFEGMLILPSAQVETNMGTLYADQRAIIADANYVAPHTKRPDPFNNPYMNDMNQGMPDINMGDMNSLFDMEGLDLENFNMEGFEMPEMPSMEDMNKMLEDMMQGFNFEMPEIEQKKDEEKTYKL